MIICKNNTNQILQIKIDASDVITLKVGGFIDLLNGRTTSKLAGSIDLAQKIIQKQVVINNGKSDMSHLDALDFIRFQQKELPLNEDGKLETAVVANKPFNDAQNFRIRIFGVKHKMQAGQTSSFDVDITEERFINGVQLIAKNHKFGDSVDFLTIDKLGTFAGVYYPPGTPLPVVLDDFGKGFYLAEDQQDQGQIMSSYPARLVPGVSVRVVYHSTGDQDVDLCLNMFMHRRGPL